MINEAATNFAANRMITIGASSAMYKRGRTSVIQKITNQGGENNMEKLIFIQTGTGIDLHGQDVNDAAERAVNNAIQSNSMPGIQDALPNQDLNNMKVNIKLGIPRDLKHLDKEKIKSLIPYGHVTVEKLEGGLATTSGIYLREQQDKNDLMYIVNAVVEVGC